MWLLNAVIIIFIVLELLNIGIIYFNIDFKYGNSIHIFKFTKKAKDNDGTKLFVNYMSNWVANSKFIFIVLLFIILFTGNEITKLITVIALIPSVAMYYLKLHNILVKLDNINELNPKGYSKTLFLIITGIILMFVGALIIYFITN